MPQRVRLTNACYQQERSAVARLQRFIDALTPPRNTARKHASQIRVSAIGNFRWSSD
ncbi:hypothetical protein F441_19709 [Phytophthora nicotianae CJ01A1]|uniref:Uncharacterized protein n=1 Tax=Phytophthora nicotianae CJ01A1 TaxID=1317063 RepID=W2VYB9_PHYNI|nr:hypothetical protein F441_19709 [Phytophthora nicotianae CJ01A1]